MDELYIGLMSGTSVDGVDAALVNFSNKFELVHTFYQPYPENVRKLILDLIRQQQATFNSLLEADSEVAVVHALAVKKLLSEARISSTRITALGFHGQTIYHQPGGTHPNSLQIGNASFLAEHSSITTVSDFRRRDMAAGGQGAPFAPAFHEFLFREPGITRAIVNIGGIANITILPADTEQPILGFDSGPGNCLLDEWYNRYRQGKFDTNGEWASHGTCDKTILATLLSDAYFALPAPKSTGREYFHLNWLARKIDLQAADPHRLHTTLAHLTCESVAQALIATAPDVKEVYVAGGGAHNRYLLSTLQKILAGVNVMTTDVIGLAPDWVEACAFAWFAKQTIDGRELALKSITGANRNCIAGCIYQ